jgi:rare lipoprotein A (peptidoglycan hydrolase)
MKSRVCRNPNGSLATALWFLLSLPAVPLVLLEFKTTASWYGPGFDGKKTASGEIFDQNKLTAASRTLPFGTKLIVRNLKNGKTCEVVINDRGPYVAGRGLDLSLEAAKQIDMPGVAPVLCYSPVAAEPAPTQSAPLPKQEPHKHSSHILVASAHLHRIAARHAAPHVSYVAYEGSHRTVFGGNPDHWNKFIRTYRG